MKKQTFLSAIFLVAVWLMASSAYGISAYGKSRKLLHYLNNQIAALNVPVHNFKHLDLSQEKKDKIFGRFYPEYKKNFRHEREYNAYIADKEERRNYDFQTLYKETRLLYNKGNVLLSQNKPIKAHKLLQQAKWKIIKIWKGLIYLNIQRTEDILQKASYISSQKLTDYNRHSGKLKLFRIAYNPREDTLLYDPKEFYLVFAKTPILNYIKKGYQALYNAKEAFGYQVTIRYKDSEGNIHNTRQSKEDEIIFREELGYYDHNFERDWLAMLNQLRQAKTNGFAIFRLLNKWRYQDIVNKYGIRYKKVRGFFDDRIPDQFQVDYIDSMNRKHQNEIERFSQHLRSRGIHPRRYVKNKNDRMVKVSGYEDDYSHVDKHFGEQNQQGQETGEEQQDNQQQVTE